VILAAWEKIKIKPDVIIFDGQGICHPRRMGIATHLGILLGIPTIGCAKSRLWGVYKPPKKEKGVYSLIKDKYTQEILGAALCTRTGTKSIFVSPGYAIDLRQSIKIIMQLSTRFRIPEPLRYCHHRAEEIKKEMQK
jgi:deoxyribonuclease V